MSTLSPNAPKYVQDLELRARKAEAALAGYEEGLAWLRTYLHSDKFGPLAAGKNPYVNVDDVLGRLSDATGLSLEYEAAEK